MEHRVELHRRPAQNGVGALVPSVALHTGHNVIGHHPEHVAAGIGRDVGRAAARQMVGIVVTSESP